MREIPLTRGAVAIVDDDDYPALAGFAWHVVKPGAARAQYAQRAGRTPEGRRFLRYMHREIMQPPPGMLIDHIDGDGLNNQRANLRLCTFAENLRNARKTTHRKGRPTTSRFRGVHRQRHAPRHPWAAQLMANRRIYRLGTFATEEEAARAYDAAAREHFGAFARLNFPDVGEQAA